VWPRQVRQVRKQCNTADSVGHSYKYFSCLDDMIKIEAFLFVACSQGK
jgi:hypothetical protein